MMRPLLLGLLLAACTTPTSTGQLTSLTQTQPECVDSSSEPSFACTVKITLDGNHLSAVGVFNDGTEHGPTASGTLTPAAKAELGRLIATFPLDVDDTIQDDGCGFAPTPATRWSIDFDNGEKRSFTYQSSSDTNVRALNEYLMKLASQVTTCSGEAMTFDACTAYTLPEG